MLEIEDREGADKIDGRITSVTKADKACEVSSAANHRDVPLSAARKCLVLLEGLERHAISCLSKSANKVVE